MAQTEKHTGYAVQRRSTRRRLIRIVAGLVAAGALMYVTLPIWVPKGWIADKIVVLLTEELNRRVEVGKISFGWGKGIVVEDLVVFGRADWPNEYFLRVGKVRCGLSPITMLLTERVDRIELIEPRIWIVFDDAGRCNIQDLRQKQEDKLLSLKYLVHRASCHVRTPQASQTFRIDDMRCQLTPETGLLKLTGDARVNRPAAGPKAASTGLFLVDAEITVPRLKREVSLGGDIRVEWKDLALTDLPVPLIPRLPIEQVDGTTTGRLTLATHPDLGIDYDLLIELDGVRVIRQGVDRPAQVPDAKLSCRGHWDPNTDLLAMHDFDYQTRALHLRRSSQSPASAMVIDAKGKMPFKLHLQGEIKDFPALRSEFPEVDAFARSINAHVDGSAAFNLNLVQGIEEDRFTLSVDGLKSGWVIAGRDTDYLSAKAGIPKTVRMEVVRNRPTQRLSQPYIVITVGDLRVSAHTELVVPVSEITDLWPWLKQVMGTLQGEMVVKTDSIEKTVGLLPFLADFTDVSEWRGPLEITATLMPQASASRFKLSALMGADMEIDVGDWFRKLPGKPLTLHAGINVPHSSTGLIDGIECELSYGASSVLVGDSDASLGYAFDFVDHGPSAGREDKTISADTSLELPLRVRGIEGLIPLVPRLAEWMHRRPDRRLSGSADVTVRSDVSYLPHDRLITSEVNLKADATVVRWEDLIDKPADDPLVLSFSHRLHLLGGLREQFLSAKAISPAGELAASLIFTHPQADRPEQGFEHVVINARIDSFEDLLKVSPAMWGWLEPLKLTGGGVFEVESLSIGETRTLSMSAEATDAGFRIPTDPPITKPTGIAARLALDFSTDSSGPDTRDQVWQLNSGRARFDGLYLTELSGELVAGRLNEDRLQGFPAGGMLIGRHVPGVFKSAELKATGHVDFDESFDQLDAYLDRFRDRCRLGGHLDWVVEAKAAPAALNLIGRLDAGQAECTVNLDSKLIPVISKTPTMPAEVNFDLKIAPAAEGDLYQVRFNDLTLAADGNSAAVTGMLDFGKGVGLSERLGESAFTGNVHIRRPEYLNELLPGAQIEFLAGGLDAIVTVKHSDGRFLLDTSRLGCDSLALGLGDERIGLDGAVVFDRSHIDIDQLNLSWGNSCGVISGVVRRRNDVDTGRVGISFEHLDVEDLAERISSLPIYGLKAGKTPDTGNRSDIIKGLLAQLQRSDLLIDANIHTLEANLPPGIPVTADEVSQRATLQSGPVNITFSSIVDGGRVTGQVGMQSELSDPTVHLTYAAERILPGELVDNYLMRTFPGMEATGPLTLIDESTVKLLPAPDDPNYDVGKGELIIEGGYVQGRAAPLWMTRFFPGLNLARFNFSYMHSWFDKKPNGEIHHRMIFQGKYWNIYMDGYGNKDNFIDYDVGIDFLADFDSKYWVDTGQGRIPLFNKTGTIMPDGSLKDETVKYVPKQFINGLLVKNNLILTAYYAVKKRVLGKQ